MREAENVEALRKRIAHLEADVRARTFELDVLWELSREFSDSLSYDELFRSILRNLETAIAYDFAAGLLVTGGDRHLYLHVLRPLAKSVQQEVLELMLRALNRLGKVSVAAEDVQVTMIEALNFDPAANCVEQLGSYFQIPMIAEHATVGFLFIGSGASHQFSEDQVRLLYTVANQASGALNRLKNMVAFERRRLHTVVQNLPEGIILLDRDQQIMMANPPGEQALTRLAGVRVGETLSHLQNEPLSELIRRSATEQLPDFVIAEAPRQVLRPKLIALDQGPLPECRLLVLSDVTDAIDEVSDRDRFLAMLAHELRNPLGPILNATNILNRSGATPESRENAREIISRQARHMSRLVDDLLDVSRFMHHKITLHRQPIDLQQLLQQTALLQQSAVEEHQLHLTIREETEPVWTDGDSVRLSQVVSNLIGNSIKYTPAGGTIEVACVRHENEAQIRIHDTGIGIPPKKLTEIFDPFTQGSEAVAYSEGGLGLGLALVRMIVNLHGGNVSVTSDGPNCGSEFVVCLPAIDPPDQTQVIGRNSAAHRERSILIIEDDHDARESLAQLLTMSGHQVATAGTGPAGIRVFRQFKPEIVLIDIHLPEMDGYEVARILRTEAEGSNTVLIALTGDSLPEDRVETNAAGFDVHVVKPLDIGRLESLLTLDVSSLATNAVCTAGHPPNPDIPSHS